MTRREFLAGSVTAGVAVSASCRETHQPRPAPRAPQGIAQVLVIDAWRAAELRRLRRGVAGHRGCPGYRSRACRRLGAGGPPRRDRSRVLRGRLGAGTDRRVGGVGPLRWRADGHLSGCAAARLRSVLPPRRESATGRAGSRSRTLRMSRRSDCTCQRRSGSPSAGVSVDGLVRRRRRPCPASSAADHRVRFRRRPFLGLRLRSQRRADPSGQPRVGRPGSRRARWRPPRRCDGGVAGSGAPDPS